VIIYRKQVNKQQKPSIWRQIGIIAVIIAIMIAIPLVLLIASDRLQYIDLGITLDQIWASLSSTDTQRNVPAQIAALAVILVIMVFAISLLFRVSINDETYNYLKNKWYWKHFFKYVVVVLQEQREKQTWHIIVGYFIAILIFIESFAMNIHAEGITDVEKDAYRAFVISVPMITTVILATRILSKLNIKLIGVNIGVFVVSVYVAEAIFLVSAGAGPLVIFDNMGNPEKLEGNARAAVIIYGLIAISTFIAATVDWFVITRIMKKPL
jgi:hypothetical protein